MRLLAPRWLLHPRPLWRLLWRLLELDSGRPELDTYGAPSYAYGKVTGLSPDVTVMTEVTESPYVCCGYCSAGMACRVARKGLDPTMSPTAHRIRNEGGRAHDAGNNASELRTGAKAAHGVKLDAIAVSEIPDRLRAGYAVTVGLDYAQLPSHLRVQSGSFGHACMLYGIEGSGSDALVGFFDPLWPQGARGAWSRWGDVKAALWGDGNHSTTVVHQEPDEPEPPEPEPPEPPEPEPEPLPPPPDPTPYDRADLELYVAEAVELTRTDRDRAWRDRTGLPQPRSSSSWSPDNADTAWSRFARWGPDLPAGSWSGPDAAWSDGADWY